MNYDPCLPWKQYTGFKAINNCFRNRSNHAFESKNNEIYEFLTKRVVLIESSFSQAFL